MTKPKNKIVSSNKKEDRIIGKVKGYNKGPTLIFIAGMHGNEPAGILALRDVLEKELHYHDENHNEKG